MKVDSEKIFDKANEHDIIGYLNSDDVDVFFKAYSVKDYFKNDFISKYNITQTELASTERFKNRIVSVIDPKNNEDT